MSDKGNILDEHYTFMRVHRQNIDFEEKDPKRMIKLSAFYPQGDNLSVDWAELCSAEETKYRASKNPERNGVIRMLAAEIRTGRFPLTLDHSPSKNNPAHSEIIGVPPRRATDIGIRAKLQSISEWVIDCKEHDVDI